jgi:phosphoglucosamine mutase
MARLFGTDGVRGVANTELDNALAYRLGQAAVTFMGPTIVVGKDTRKSGDMLEASIIAGITSAGGDALRVGVIPTPAVALLVRELHAAGGIVISASHNPPEYNGIKFFDGEGYKLPDAVEDRIQEFIAAGGLEGETTAAGASMPTGDGVGAVVDVDEAMEMYIEHAVQAIKGQGVDFSGMKIAVDTAHGASSYTTPEALRRLGAEVVVINDDWDGNDINVLCGSTHLEPLHRLMEESGAQVGIAHDGDADRVMMVTPSGAEVDGDFVEAVLALDMKQRGALPHDTVVSTVMANLGFVRAMKANGINVVHTKVGDRYVLEAMREGGYAIGGEQSGHMILLDYNSTGDGLMTAVQFLAAYVRSGKPIDELLGVMQRLPQSLINVRVNDKHALEGNQPIWDAVHTAEAAMGDDGRVLVRTSGTEPVIRVMVEAVDPDVAETQAQAIAKVVEEQLG